MAAIKGQDSPTNTAVFSQALLDPAAYVGMGNDTGLITAPFLNEEGVHQGAIEGRWFFAIRCNDAFQWLNTTLAEYGGGVVAIVDDNYQMGLPAVIFPANRTFNRDLREVGLKLNPDRSKCYIE